MGAVKRTSGIANLDHCQSASVLKGLEERTFWTVNFENQLLAS